ncbi:MAG: LamB/YcsF family protein [Acidimicrobiales bacterium]
MRAPVREVLVVRAGSLTTIQDAGRSGLAHLAVPPSGALDRPAWRLANRLVGNPEGAAALETTITGVALQAHHPCVMAVTGARARVAVDGRPAGWGMAVALGAGRTLLAGLRAVAECFADRAYTPDGRLAPRGQPGAVIHEEVAVVARAVQMAVQGTATSVDGRTVKVEARSICLHSDTPGAGELAGRIRAGLEAAGEVIGPFVDP